MEQGVRYTNLRIDQDRGCLTSIDRVSFIFPLPVIGLQIIKTSFVIKWQIFLN